MHDHLLLFQIFAKKFFLFWFSLGWLPKNQNTLLFPKMASLNNWCEQRHLNIRIESIWMERFIWIYLFGSIYAQIHSSISHLERSCLVNWNEMEMRYTDLNSDEWCEHKTIYFEFIESIFASVLWISNATQISNRDWLQNLKPFNAMLPTFYMSRMENTTCYCTWKHSNVYFIVYC